MNVMAIPMNNFKKTHTRRSLSKARIGNLQKNHLEISEFIVEKKEFSAKDLISLGEQNNRLDLSPLLTDILLKNEEKNRKV